MIRFAALFLAAIILALLFATQTWSSAARPPLAGLSRAADAAVSLRRPEFTLLLQMELIRWAGWALVAPFVVVLVRRFPLGKEKMLRNSAILAIAALPAAALRTFVVLCIVIVVRGQYPVGLMEGFVVAMRGRFALDVFIYLMIVAASHAGILLGETRRRDIREAQLATQLVSARLTALEAQLHPHFFFNTLHTISALLDRDTASARRVLTRFGDLMRMLLESSHHPKTTLGWEYSFLSCYADIQQVRFGDKVCFRFALNENDAALVPRLILQPLVENAVRYGVEGAAGMVTVAVEATRLNGQLRLTVRDTGAGLRQGAVVEGVGLRTTRQRLRAAYGSLASLTLTAVETGGVAATIVLPYEVDHSPRRPFTDAAQRIRRPAVTVDSARH